MEMGGEGRKGRRGLSFCRIQLLLLPLVARGRLDDVDELFVSVVANVLPSFLVRARTRRLRLLFLFGTSALPLTTHVHPGQLSTGSKSVNTITLGFLFGVTAYAETFNSSVLTSISAFFSLLPVSLAVLHEHQCDILPSPSRPNRASSASL